MSSEVPWSLESLQRLESLRPVDANAWLKIVLDAILEATGAETGLLRCVFERGGDTCEAFRADHTAGRSIRDLTRHIDGMVDLEIRADDRVIGTSCHLGDEDSASTRLYLEWPVTRITSTAIRGHMADLRSTLSRLVEERRCFEQSLHDSLTGLHSPKSFQAVAAALLGDLRHDVAEVSCAVVNVDRLKQVNDVHGFLIGDRALVNVARWIQSSMKPGQVAGRTMGNEFSVLLPGVPMEAAVAWTEDLRRGIAGSPLDHEGKRIECRVSAGVASARAIDSYDLLELCRTSTEMLLLAKFTGRDRVLAATQENIEHYERAGLSLAAYF